MPYFFLSKTVYRQLVNGLITLMLLLPLSVHAQQNPIKYVNPFVGTGGHGHTYPGATVPHGMVQLSPDTRLTGWDGCGGYHYDDNFIYGFSHTHLSGTGVSDYGDILLMPGSGKPSPDNKVYGSAFSHTKEKASPGYYEVHLDDDNIDAEFTVTERAGMHHYRFDGNNNNFILLDLKHRDEVIASSLKIVNDSTITGLRRSKAWAVDQYVYFAIRFSVPIKTIQVWQNDVLTNGRGNSFEGNNIKAAFLFDTKQPADLYVKVGISAVDEKGALNNLDTEIPHWDFNEVRKQAEQKWNENLASIIVKGDEEKKKIFYTALYHTAIVPNLYTDVDKRYRGRDNQIHTAEDNTNYTVFSLWDTYRATHPLYTIIDKQRTLDYINSFLTQYKQGGRLPVWELAANETECMIGYHAVPVIVDAYMKGITNFDTKLALEAMVHSANLDHFGLMAYKGKGMIESDDEQESVSRTLEYAYDDWCIATFAKEIGDMKVYKEFISRAQNYKNVLDLSTGFMRPRKNGDWLTPFEPREVNNNYTEANSWQYSFYMPQDIQGYLQMTGGRLALEKKLDALFSAEDKTTGREQSDITGLIGQYAHGNEPSHHIAYLYNYAGRSAKAVEKIHFIMNNFYSNTPDGLIGNEDCGQMSAWYVMSALGFYPVTPGATFFDIGAPAFEEVKIRIGDGYFTINAPGVSDKKKYVSSFQVNFGKDSILITEVLPNTVIQTGASINFIMTDDSAESRSIIFAAGNKIPDENFVINPVLHGGNISFKNSRKTSISCNTSGAEIYYTTDGKTPSISSKKYAAPFIIDKSTTLKAIAIKGNNSSKIVTAEYKKMVHDWEVKLNTAFEPMYAAGGADGLIDGIKGEVEWRKGNWQGYQKNDMDVIVDFKKLQVVKSVSVNFLQDTRAWIVMPSEVSLLFSNDGKNFRDFAVIKSTVLIDDLEANTHLLSFSVPSVKARFVRIIAKQYGKLPAWHESAGGDTHIFVDEIVVE